MKKIVLLSLLIASLSFGITIRGPFVNSANITSNLPNEVVTSNYTNAVRLNNTVLVDSILEDTSTHGVSLDTGVLVKDDAITAGGTITGGTFTDGTATLTGGDITGLTSAVVDNVTINGDDITSSGTLTLEGTVTVAGGAVGGITTADISDSLAVGTNDLVVNTAKNVVGIGLADGSAFLSSTSWTGLNVQAGTVAEMGANGASGARLVLADTNATSGQRGFSIFTDTGVTILGKEADALSSLTAMLTFTHATNAAAFAGGVTLTSSIDIGTFLNLTPTNTTPSATEGNCFFHDTDNVVRCYGGAAWNDLW